MAEIAGDIRLEHLYHYFLACELARNKTVLNIACGDGEGADLLASVARAVIAVDSAPDLIERASRRYARPNLRFRGGSCTAIPVMDGSIDLIVSFETVEDHTEHARIVEEMRRVLAPGGVLIVSMGERSGVVRHRDPSAVGTRHRQEFECLLRAYFSHVSLVGPRAPRQPIVCASDAPVPPVPVGLLDGGKFVWLDRSSTLLAAPHSADTTDALARRVSDLARILAHKRQRLADLRELIARLHLAIEQHREDSLAAWDQVRARDARLVDLEQRHSAVLEEARAAHQRALAEAERWAADRVTQAEEEAAARAQELVAVIVRTLDAERVSRQTDIAAERARAQMRETQLLAHVEQLAAGLAAREQVIAVMEGSRSWRFTRPLRELRRFASKMVALASTSPPGKEVRR